MPQSEDLTVTRADLAEFIDVNGKDPNEIALFLYDRGFSEEAVESALSTLDSY